VFARAFGLVRRALLFSATNMPMRRRQNCFKRIKQRLLETFDVLRINSGSFNAKERLVGVGSLPDG
jgi:hypothetical protein